MKKIGADFWPANPLKTYRLFADIQTRAHAEKIEILREDQVINYLVRRGYFESLKYIFDQSTAEEKRALLHAAGADDVVRCNEQGELALAPEIQQQRHAHIRRACVRERHAGRQRRQDLLRLDF